jgi:hypothetical protein
MKGSPQTTGYISSNAISISEWFSQGRINPLKPKRESIIVEVMRKHLGESERRLRGKKEHLVRKYPGNARSSF